MRHAPFIVVAFVMCGIASMACPARGQVCGTLADAFVAEGVGLRREWVVQIPFDSASSRLEHVTVADGVVVAMAGDGSLHGIAAGGVEPGRPMPGTLLWTRHFNRADGNLQTPAVGGGVVVIAGDFRVLAIDIQSGRTLWEEPLAHPPTAAAVMSGDWVYLPVEGERLIRYAVNPYRTPQEMLPPAADRDAKGKKTESPEPTPARALTVDERVKPLSISTHGRVELRPKPFEGGVLWCTAAGLITAILPGKSEWQRLEFDLGRPAAGNVLIQGTTIFATTNPGTSAADVIRIDRLPAGLAYRWRAPLGDSVAGDIRAVGDTLLVPLATGGLAALAATDGARLWMHEPQTQLVAITSQRLWAIDAMGRLVTLDPVDGRRLQRFCLVPFHLPVVNTVSDRLVLASPGGVVASLAPRGDLPVAAAGPVPADAPPMPVP